MHKLPILFLALLVAVASFGRSTPSMGRPAEEVTSGGITMRLIPGAPFLMGSADGLGVPVYNEIPVHEVTVSPFLISRTEITRKQYREYSNKTGKPLPPGDTGRDGKEPMTGITWDEAVAFCKWHGGRLPTEAEWEYAARGGLVQKAFPYGDDITHEQENYEGTSGADVWSGVAPVGMLAPNGYGLHDVAGNVSEWCLDWYADAYYAESAKVNPTGPTSGTHKVHRGGDHRSKREDLRVAARNYSKPDRAFGNVGFRLVMTTQEKL